MMHDKPTRFAGVSLPNQFKPETAARITIWALKYYAAKGVNEVL